MVNLRVKIKRDMELNALNICNFKNIEEATLEFSDKVNCLLGNNGMGKSNLLDAIYCMSFTKSFTGVTDGMLIRTGAEWMTLRGDYTRRGTAEQLSMGLQRGKRKSLRRGGKEYQRLSMHIGVFPLVMVAPQDIEILRGGGEERRRWMDMVISQSDAQYLDAIIRYGAALEQRNRLLREGCVDHSLYEAVEATMELPAQRISRTRSEWVKELTRLFERYYREIAGEEAGRVSLDYRCSLDASPDGTMGGLLDSSRRHDEMLRHTTAGPHRDDIEMSLEGMPVRRTGSQGQCKTFTVALRMAQYEFLERSSGVRPLLLLDDVFDKLDAERVERIMAMVTGENFGQIFITDTNRRHLDEIVERAGNDYRLWEVEKGRFTPTGI